MPLAQITILEGRSEAMVSDMAAAVTDAISRTLSAPREKIRVVVNEVPATRWFVAGHSMAEQAMAEQAARSNVTQVSSQGGSTGRSGEGV